MGFGHGGGLEVVAVSVAVFGEGGRRVMGV